MEFKIWFLTHSDSKCSAATRGQWLLKAQTHNISATVRRPGGQCCPRTYQGIRNKDPCLLGVPRPDTVLPPMAAKGFFLKQKSAVSHLCLNSPLPILVTRKKKSRSSCGWPGLMSTQRSATCTGHTTAGADWGTWERGHRGAERPRRHEAL